MPSAIEEIDRGWSPMGNLCQSFGLRLPIQTLLLERTFMSEPQPRLANTIPQYYG